MFRLMPIIILFSLSLTACVERKYSADRENVMPLEQTKAECEYEAEKATANIRDPYEAGFEHSKLTRLCMESKGYKQTR